MKSRLFLLLVVFVLAPHRDGLSALVQPNCLEFEASADGSLSVYDGANWLADHQLSVEFIVDVRQVVRKWVGLTDPNHFRVLIAADREEIWRLVPEMRNWGKAGVVGYFAWNSSCQLVWTNNPVDHAFVIHEGHHYDQYIFAGLVHEFAHWHGAEHGHEDPGYIGLRDTNNWYDERDLKLEIAEAAWFNSCGIIAQQVWRAERPDQELGQFRFSLFASHPYVLACLDLAQVVREHGLNNTQR